jgi:hypothetical protein
VEVSPTGGMNILQQAARDPQVVAAREAVEQWKKQLDHVELSLSVPREQRAQLNPDLQKQVWDHKSHTVATFMPVPFMLGLLGTEVGMLAATAAIPALAPARSLLVLGSLVAYWKFSPTVVGKALRTWVLPPMVDKGVKRELQAERQSYSQHLQEATTYQDALTRKVTDRLFKAAAEEQATKEAEKAAHPEGQVQESDGFIVVNGIRVPKKVST